MKELGTKGSDKYNPIVTSIITELMKENSPEVDWTIISDLILSPLMSKSTDDIMKSLLDCLSEGKENIAPIFQNFYNKR